MAGLIRPWHLRSPSEAIAHGKRILDAAPGANGEDSIWLRIQLAHVLMRRSELGQVEELLDRALLGLDSVDMPMARIVALSNRGWWCRESGDEATSMELIHEALRIAQANGFPRLEAGAHTNLGEFARQRGDYEEAKQHYLEALDKCDSKLRSGMNLYNLGQLSVEHNDFQGAERYYREGLSWLSDVGPIPMVCALYGGLGMTLMLQGDVQGGGLLMGWSRGHSTQQNFVMDLIDRQLFERMVAAGEEREGFVSAFQAGMRMTFQEVRNLLLEASPSLKGGESLEC